jgi:copper(I)-binding protein
MQRQFPRSRSIPWVVALACALAIGTAALADEKGVVVKDPWMQSIIPSRPAAGYFTLSNATARPATLVGAASPDCGMLMLHRSSRMNGEEHMAMVQSIVVPAHGAVKFAPGGYHLMCTEPSKALKPGASVPVTLRFADGSTVTASFPVRGAAGK